MNVLGFPRIPLDYDLRPMAEDTCEAPSKTLFFTFETMLTVFDR